MKLNIDLNYILKRILVIVLAFIIISQLKSCNVQALGYQMTPRACYLYYGTGTTNSSGTYSSYVANGNINLYGCTINTSQFFYSTRFDYRLSTEDSGIGTATFFIQALYQISSVTITTSYVDYSCELNTGMLVPIDSTSSTHYARLYSVTCSNIPINNLTSYSVRIYRYSSGNIATGVTGDWISRDWNITLNDSSNITEAINSQSSQAHSDSQAINNSINDGSIESNTNNGGGIFDVDSNGQSSIIPNNNFGLAGVITAPLVILNRAQEACTSKSFIIFNKSITLPCGDSLFWNRDFSSQASIFNNGQSGSGLNNTRNGFRVVWNALFGGAIIFHLLVKLWDVIQKALDPNDNGYETISSAIDTGPKPDVVRDSDGDEYIPKHSREGYTPKHKFKGLNPASNGGVS